MPKGGVRIRDLLAGERSAVVTSVLISLVAAMILWALYQFGPLNTLEFKSLDLFQKYNAPIEDPGVVIVRVDQESLTAFSEKGIHWPWPRQVYAPLIDVFARGEARGIIFDIIFSEPSSYGREDDLEFARAIKKARNVFFPITMRSDANYESDISPIRRFGVKDDARKLRLPEAQSYVPPIGEVVAEARGLGDVIISPDSDGVYRKIPLFTRYQEYLFPCLAASPLKERFTLKGKSILFDAKPLPVNERGELLLHYYGQEFQFPTFNVLNIVSACQNPEGPFFDRVAGPIRGRFVIVALTAPGLYDLKPTAVNSQSPGGYIHGTLVTNLLHDHHIRTASDISKFVFLFLAGVVLGLLIFGGFSFWRNSLTVLSFMMGCAVVSFGLFHYYHYWMGFLPQEVSFLLIFGIVATYRYSTEGKRRRQIRKLFSQYMSEILVRELESNPERAKLGGERRFITIFFSDLANFAGISEQFEPEKIVGLLNDYFREMSQIILDSRGIIDKYQGDGIMAFWGSPIPLEDHAIRACLAALACQQRMKGINGKLRSEGFPPLSMRIGLHTGEAIVGNMGSTQRFDYTIVGDNVNLASRLEGINKHFGTGITISENTYQLARERIEARELDLIAVPGRKKPVRVFQLLGERGKITENDKRVKALFEDGLKSYKIGKFKEAKKTFEKVTEINPHDQPSRTFIVRCKDFMEAPPAKWDGVFRPTEK